MLFCALLLYACFEVVVVVAEGNWTLTGQRLLGWTGNRRQLQNSSLNLIPSRLKDCWLYSMVVVSKSAGKWSQSHDNWLWFADILTNAIYMAWKCWLQLRLQSSFPSPCGYLSASTVLAQDYRLWQWTGVKYPGRLLILEHQLGTIFFHLIIICSILYLHCRKGKTINRLTFISDWFELLSQIMGLSIVVQ